MAVSNFLLQEPENCLVQENYPCAVKALQKDSLSWQGLSLRLSQGTALLLYGDRQFRVITGKLGVSSLETATVHEASVQLLIQGDIWMEKKNKKQILVRNLQGRLRVMPLHKPQNSEALQEIPPGFENWFSGMNSEGNLEQGTLQLISQKKFLEEWNRLYRLPRQQALEKANTYLNLWKDKNNEIAALYGLVAQRMVASLEAERERQLQQEILRRQERQKLLKIYREKYTLGEVP
jgi:hypothetical protein